MKKLFPILVIVLLSTVVFTSCKDDEPVITTAPGTVEFEFEYVWAAGEAPFALNKALFHMRTGDTLTFQSFKNYVSNIALKKDDGTYWIAPNSYHLIDAADKASMKVVFTDVPAGTYTGVQLVVGVDSAANADGPKLGDLSADNKMFWDNSNGYIMIKAEGTSPQSKSGTFAYHLGGFTGDFKTQLKRDLIMPGESTISIDGNTSKVKLRMNPARLFHSYGSVVNGDSITTPGENAFTVASRFNTWVKIHEISN